MNRKIVNRWTVRRDLKNEEATCGQSQSSALILSTIDPTAKFQPFRWPEMNPLGQDWIMMKNAANREFSFRKIISSGKKCPRQTWVGGKPQQRIVSVTCSIWCDLRVQPHLDCGVLLTSRIIWDPRCAISVIKIFVWSNFRIPEMIFVLFTGPNKLFQR